MTAFNWMCTSTTTTNCTTFRTAIKMFFYVCSPPSSPRTHTHARTYYFGMSEQSTRCSNFSYCCCFVAMARAFVCNFMRYFTRERQWKRAIERMSEHVDFTNFVAYIHLWLADAGLFTRQIMSLPHEVQWIRSLFCSLALFVNVRFSFLPLSAHKYTFPPIKHFLLVTIAHDNQEQQKDTNDPGSPCVGISFRQHHFALPGSRTPRMNRWTMFRGKSLMDR